MLRQARSKAYEIVNFFRKEVFLIFHYFVESRGAYLTVFGRPESFKAARVNLQGRWWSRHAKRKLGKNAYESGR